MIWEAFVRRKIVHSTASFLATAPLRVSRTGCTLHLRESLTSGAVDINGWRAPARQGGMGFTHGRAPSGTVTGRAVPETLPPAEARRGLLWSQGLIGPRRGGAQTPLA